MSDTSGTSAASTPGQPQFGGEQNRPRNGLGPTAVILGVVGVLFGVFPATFFIAAPLGIAGVFIGRAGHRRCMRGDANNGRVAMLGAVISGAACVLACIGAVIFFSTS